MFSVFGEALMRMEHEMNYNEVKLIIDLFTTLTSYCIQTYLSLIPTSLPYTSQH